MYQQFGHKLLVCFVSLYVLVLCPPAVLGNDTETECKRVLAAQGRPCNDDWFFERDCLGNSNSTYKCSVNNLTAEATMLAVGTGILLILALLMCCKCQALKRRSSITRKEYALAKSSSSDHVELTAVGGDKQRVKSELAEHFAEKAKHFQKPTPEDKEIEFSVSVLTEDEEHSDDGNVANSTTSEDKDTSYEDMEDVAIEFSVTDITIDENTVMEAEQSLAQLRSMVDPVDMTIPENKAVDGPDVFELTEIVCETSRNFSPTKTMHSSRRSTSESPTSPNTRFEHRSKSQNDVPSGRYTLPPNMSRSRSIQRSQAIQLQKPSRRTRPGRARRMRSRAGSFTGAQRSRRGSTE